MSFVIALAYLGGMHWLIDQDRPFWRSVFWPYFLGKSIARHMADDL